MRHTISVVVQNEFGVLARIAGMFSARGYNIESLCVAETLDPKLSRMTIVTSGEDAVIEQITKQLNRLVDVIKVQDVTSQVHVERELLMARIEPTDAQRAEVLRIVDIFRGKVVDVSPKSMTIELTGGQDKLEAFMNLVRPLGLRDVARTGRVAMSRGR